MERWLTPRRNSTYKRPFTWEGNYLVWCSGMQGIYARLPRGSSSASWSADMTCNNRLHWYFLISWPFRMGSHWWHRSAKSSLLSLVVSKGGSSASWSVYMTCNNRPHWYFLISWLFRMGSHWWHRSVKSSLFSLAVSNRGEDISQRRFVCQIWTHFWFYSCFTEFFHFYIYKQKTNQTTSIQWKELYQRMEKK